MARVRINELPRFLAEDTNEKTLGIIVDDPVNPNETLIIPLVLKGVTSYLTSGKPRPSEYEDELIPRIDMTSNEPVWGPSETNFANRENAMIIFGGEVISSETIASGKRIINTLSVGEDDAVDFRDDNKFFNGITTKFNVDIVDMSKGIYSLNSKSLSQKRLISMESERRTV